MMKWVLCARIVVEANINIMTGTLYVTRVVVQYVCDDWEGEFYGRQNA